jgi:hypothetical protein
MQELQLGELPGTIANCICSIILVCTINQMLYRQQVQLYYVLMGREIV